ncbi:hypothetical protein [Allosediminivita pacifica]|uniref:PemK-like, MazF-like toxin of type II toxin-antitoxin system n=1 Tax=Allosediminivita pacifica TaxID=1267769 RepID=A0A2T5ZYX8_9RHOB|nr:hypothetical protein [Allosediminivita pacifica]PTX36743.1 hypothetical protein C8N44_1553 [Allosediminivita pacifica]GGB30482.1 hypothetical protein GCM10011324_44990 [Allosediminivita pacifica]
MFHPKQAFEGPPIWHEELQRGDVVLFRFPVAEADEPSDTVTPKVRPCLVLEVHERMGRRSATLAYGTSAKTRANSGYNVMVATEDGIDCAGLDRPTRFVGVRRITVALEHSGFEFADRTASPIIRRLDAALTGRMNAVRARVHTEADIARERRRERREEQRRWQQQSRGFLERNRRLPAASPLTKGHTND